MRIRPGNCASGKTLNPNLLAVAIAILCRWVSNNNDVRFFGSIIAFAGVLYVEAACTDLSFIGPEMLGNIQSSDITEASGLAASWRNPGIFWTHNDGAREKVFALSATGTLLATFKLTKSVDDVEDIAVGPGPDAAVSYLYVADIGSNNADRDEVQIMRIPEPQVNPGEEAGTSDFKNLQNFVLKYPSGKFDAEALLVDPVGRELFVATKEENGSHLFRAKIDALTTSGKGILEAVGQLEFARISGGAVSRDGQFIALRREDEAHFWRRQPGEAVVDALRRPARPLPVVGPPAEPNGEGLTFLLDDSGYITISEGTKQPLYLFRRVEAGSQPEFVGQPLISADGLLIQVSSCAGTQVVVQRSTDLHTWENAEVFTSTGAVHTYAEPGVVTRRFFRLLAQ
jgi:hypothetical protein